MSLIVYTHTQGAPQNTTLDQMSLNLPTTTNPERSREAASPSTSNTPAPNHRSDEEWLILSSLSETEDDPLTPSEDFPFSPEEASSDAALPDDSVATISSSVVDTLSATHVEGGLGEPATIVKPKVELEKPAVQQANPEASAGAGAGEALGFFTYCAMELERLRGKMKVEELTLREVARYFLFRLAVENELLLASLFAASMVGTFVFAFSLMSNPFAQWLHPAELAVLTHPVSTVRYNLPWVPSCEYETAWPFGARCSIKPIEVSLLVEVEAPRGARVLLVKLEAPLQLPSGWVVASDRFGAAKAWAGERWAQLPIEGLRDELRDSARMAVKSTDWCLKEFDMFADKMRTQVRLTLVGASEAVSGRWSTGRKAAVDWAKRQPQYAAFAARGARDLNEQLHRIAESTMLRFVQQASRFAEQVLNAELSFKWPVPR